MVKLEDAVIARYSTKGHKFEILVDPKLAYALKQGKQVDFNELLAAEEVFKDAKQGERASVALLQEVFGTTDITEIAKRIILKGEIQLTTEQRRELRERKKREIIQIICRNAWDPKLNAPHPPARIEKAIEELRVHINEFEPAEEQANRIIKELQRLLPISVEKFQIAVKVPAKYAGKASGIIYAYDVKKQEWLSDGSFIALVELPAGLRTEFLEKIAKATQGEASIKILEKGAKI